MELNYYDELMHHLEEFRFLIVCPSLARNKPAFLDNIERTFNNMIQSEILRDEFDWAIVKRLYNDQRSTLNSIWKLKISLRFVLELFCRFDCRETLFIKKIVRMYHKILGAYQALDVCPNCMQQNNPKHYLGEDNFNCLVILSAVNELPSQIYSFANRVLYWNLSKFAVFEGDYVFLNFLVKYGLSYFPLYLEDLREEVKNELGHMYRNYRQYRNGIQMAETQEFVDDVLSNISNNYNNFNFRKLLLTLKYVFICYRRHVGDNYFQDYARCLNLFVLTVPETVVSINDVQELLNLMFGPDITFRNEMLSVFHELFPENPRFCSPRSLKHLCRCKIRDWVRKVPSFPSVIAEIQLPTALKNYLLLNGE